jgi:hypothetical protein
MNVATRILHLPIPVELHRRAKKAAIDANIPFGDFVRRTLDRASRPDGEGALTPQPAASPAQQAEPAVESAPAKNIRQLTLKQFRRRVSL